MRPIWWSFSFFFKKKINIHWSRVDLILEDGGLVSVSVQGDTFYNL